jgi:hypothetical protein
MADGQNKRFPPKPPKLDIRTNTNDSPHVVILGAGASKAALPKGDANGRLIPVMAEIVKLAGLKPLLTEHGVTSGYDDFESLYDTIANSPEHQPLADELRKAIQSYFSQLKLPDTVTLYDQLVLSLREKDLIATFNWDPFLAQAWKRNRHVAHLPQILFLHGNVEIGVCRKHRIKKFIGDRCSICGEEVEPTELLYPIRNKNYSEDPFINGEWSTLRLYLNQAYFLTIFGYAAPITDCEAKELMLSVWKDNQLFDLAEIDIIDVKHRPDLTKTWDPFFCRSHYGMWRRFSQSYLFDHPRRSCEAFAMATLQCAPWQNNPLPKFKKLTELQNWIRCLWKEEQLGRLSGKTCEALLQDRETVTVAHPHVDDEIVVRPDYVERRSKSGMPSNFRFLVICRSVGNELGMVSIGHVVDTIEISEGGFPCTIELYAVFGLVLGEPIWGKELHLMAWRFDMEKGRTTINGYAGTRITRT